jgi:glycosyltransferase involved in cell wall biosynthesis
LKANKVIGIDARFMLRPLRGIPLYVLRLCQNLPALKKGYHFVYFINKGFEHNDSPENYLPRIENIEKNNFNVIFVNCNDDAEIKWEQIYLPRLIKQHKLDLLHMPGNRICFFPGVPTIVTVHDVMEYLYFWKRFKKNISTVRSTRMLFYLTKMAGYVFANYTIGFQKASKIVTVSQYSAKDIATTLKIKTSNIRSIHHGLDVDYLCDNPTSLKDRDFILMLGGDSFQKNPELAINAWAQVDPTLRKKYPLRIVGFCGSVSSPLLTAIKRNDIEDQVEIKGWLSQEEMVQSFKDAALLLFPSRYEGFGFPLLQAMASGTPVISTNKSSIPEVLGDVGFQFDSNDVDGMAAGIKNLLTDTAEWKKQSESGYQRSLLFRWEFSAQKHLDVYEELLLAN